MHAMQSMRPHLCPSVSPAPHGYRKDTSFCYIARLATTPYTTTKKLTARGGRTQHVTAPGGGARAASTRLDRTSTMRAVFAAPSFGRGCCAAARGKRGVFLVSNRPICKEHP